jgi:hypothetical protein
MLVFLSVLTPAHAQAQNADALAAAPAAAAVKLAKDLNESVTGIDVTVKDLYGRTITGKVVITQFKPDGDGPFPILILNHGAAPRTVLSRRVFVIPSKYVILSGADLRYLNQPVLVTAKWVPILIPKKWRM